jgi:hypothetical protein
MKKHRRWGLTEEKILIDNYLKCTIKELEILFPERNRESINNKIKRLKAEGKIKEGKPEDVVYRAYDQRGEKKPFMTIDQLLNR